jgi:hypothetical protein
LFYEAHLLTLALLKLSGMKLLITPLLLCLLNPIVNATIRTVSNAISLPAQYTNMAAAMAASSNGDTLYVYGTDLDYGDITITQQLVIIGTGPFPYSKLNTQRTIFNSVLLSPGSDGSIIRGIYINISVATGNAQINNITLKNLGFGSFCRVYGNNWLIENCVFLTGNGNNIYFEFGPSSGITVAGCSFSGYINSNGKTVSNFVVNNSQFLYVGDSFAGSLTANITNNIFSKNATNGTSGAIYKNNLTCNGSTPLDNVFPNQGNVNSTATANSIFVSYSFGSGFSVAFDFHLPPGSPALGIGYVSGDAGMYSGSSPVTSSQNEFFPNLPVIQYMILNSTSVPQGGNLSVKLKTFKQN